MRKIVGALLLLVNRQIQEEKLVFGEIPPGLLIFPLVKWKMMPAENTVIQDLDKVMMRCKAMAADPTTGRQPTNREIAARAKALGATFRENRISEWLLGKTVPDIHNLSYFLAALGLTFSDFDRATRIVSGSAGDAGQRSAGSSDTEALGIAEQILERKLREDPAVAAALARIVSGAEDRRRQG